MGYGSAIILIILLIYYIRRRRDFLDILVITSLFLVLMCEFFYLNDYAVSVHYRFNTVFKIYSMAWIILGTTTIIFSAKFLEQSKKIDKIKHFDKILPAIVILLLIGIIPLSIAIFGISDPIGLQRRCIS